MQSKPKVAVIILTMNQKEKTLRCLRSLSQVLYTQMIILLFDNGSTDNTIDTVKKEFPFIITHFSDTNLGVASGRNAAAEISKKIFNPNFFLFLDNDTVVEIDFLENLLEPFENDNSIAITTSKIKCNDDSGLLFSAGGCKINFWIGKTSQRGGKEMDQEKYNIPVDCISNGGCMMVKSEIFYELNGFDPVYNLYGPEDLDFSLRVLAKSYRIRYTPKAVIYHDPEPSRTSSGGKINETYMNQKTRNWFIFLLRHAPVTKKIVFLLFFAPLKFSWMFFRGIAKGDLKLPLAIIKGFYSFAFTKKKFSR